MHFDPARHSHADTYKLLTNLVVPRPIAWISSQGRAGVVNLAPFSFFNAVGSEPPFVAVGIGAGPDGAPKDTARNLAETGEFVVNLVTEDLLGPMNLTAADFPATESEVAAAGLTVVPSLQVAAPRIAEAQASLECRVHSTQALGSYTLVIGQVVMFHVEDALVGQRLQIAGFAPLGRMGSPSVYCRTTDRIDEPRIRYAQWQEGKA